MSSEKRDPEQIYGNTILVEPESIKYDMESLMDNARESLPPEMMEKVSYFLSWKYEP